MHAALRRLQGEATCLKDKTMSWLLSDVAIARGHILKEVGAARHFLTYCGLGPKDNILREKCIRCLEFAQESDRLLLKTT